MILKQDMNDIQLLIINFMRDYQKISEYKLTLLVFRQYSKENVKLLKAEIKNINEKTKWKIKRIRYYGYQIKKLERKEVK